MFGNELHAFALVSFYSPPNEYLLQYTQMTLAVCRHNSESPLAVIDTKSILLVVAMVPFLFLINGHGDQYFMVEKIGLDVVEVDNPKDDE